MAEKKIRAWLIGLAACSMALFYASGNVVMAADSTAQNADITVCISKNAYPPMFWVKDGQYHGFDAESMMAVAEKLGVKVKFVAMDFAGLLPGLMSRRCDVLRSALYVSAKRTKVADALPYLRAESVLVVQNGSKSISKPSDLAGKRISVQASSTMQRTLEAMSAKFKEEGLAPIHVLPYPTVPGAVAALRNGRADGLIETHVAAINITNIKANDMHIVRNIFNTKKKINYGMYFRPGSDALEHRIFSAMKALEQAGKIDAIAEKYRIPVDNIVKFTHGTFDDFIVRHGAQP